MSLRRGIEPIIATVILVAVALIIAVAVVGYLMGLFGGLTGGTPQISITSVVARLAGNDILQVEIYVNNAGAGSDKLVKVEVIYPGGSRTKETTKTITGNYRGWETIPIEGVSVSLGDTVILKLYFEKSGTHTINVVVTPGQTTQTTTTPTTTTNAQ